MSPLLLASLLAIGSAQDLFLSFPKLQNDGGRGNASWGVEPMKVSDIKPENLLPSFFWMAKSAEGGSYVNTQGYKGGLGTPNPFDPPNHCPDDIFDGTMEDDRVPVMPYLEQDDWGCERADRDVPVIVLENDILRAAITPQWGGKIWSVYHKRDKRQMVFNNPAHQPANIAYRKAWTSGGVEWNWSPGHIGHSVSTEDIVHAAKISTTRGDVVRLWDFDRLNNTVWQVDIMLEGDSLYAHVTITNPGTSDLRGYWWTCVAMSVTDKTRVVLPAHDQSSPCVEWPYGAYILDNTSFRGPDVGNPRRAFEQDMSWIGNIPGNHDFFFHGWRPQKRYPLSYITWVDEDGYSVVHAHGKRDAPGINNGTKFFTWGTTDNGKFQCDFLSASDYQNEKCLQNPGTYYNYYDPHCAHYEHLGLYTELQTGPAHSQRHTFPLPASSTVQWTEVFKAWKANVTRMHHPDYLGEEGPVEETEQWLGSAEGVPFAMFQSVDKFLEELAHTPVKPENMLYYGQPWGALHEKLTGKRLAPGAPFNGSHLSALPTTRLWVELLHDGAFSEATLSRIPESFQVSPEWINILNMSLNEHPPGTWLHHLLLGTAALEQGHRDKAERSFQDSMHMKPNVHAARNLATIAPDVQSSLAYYQQAWSVWLQWDSADPNRARLGRNLASEICIWMVSSSLVEPLGQFLARLEHSCAGCVDADHVLHAKAFLFVHNGEYEHALELLFSHCFPTYAADRQLLIDLWYEAHLQMETARLGRTLTRKDVVLLRRKIGCDGESTILTWKDKCKRGPPNLGYSY